MTNAYELRAEHRHRLRKMRSDKIKAARVEEVDRVCLRYEQAYFDFYKQRCVVRYEKGWFWAHRHKYRQSVLEDITSFLLAKLHDQELYQED